MEVYKSRRSSESEEPTAEEIKQAMESRLTDQQRTEALLKLRKRQDT